ncbi:voltage-gated potassium channel [Rhodoligotrophos appendicifer]|uniref:cyclic nucleotide-gated ion channel n=1 Tax=Rhodoligotrophos appendicifer TaxID=987056 RepID=UPI0011851663|nr:cyclic nucleotide-gated ion channel [Rhodoligotrophos appendicifer]
MPARKKRLRTIRRAVFDILEGGRRGEVTARILNDFVIVLIIANVGAAIVETVSWIQADYGAIFNAFDTVCVTIFIIEYAARIWTAPENPIFRQLNPWKARSRFAAAPLMIIDLVAIIPFFLEFLLPADFAILRVLRFIRFFRLTRYSTAMGTIGRVLAAERRSLFAAAVLMISAMLVSSVAMYLAERFAQPDKFGDVPSAMWWSIVTLATVGYGDVVPITLIGKVIGGVTIIIGLGLFALPVAIVATGFQNEIHRRDFVVSYGLVARVPLFSHLDADGIVQVVRMLSARRVPAGAIIVRRGEPADAMFFIVSGSVEVAVRGKPVKLIAGEFFGEMALLARSERTATVRALEPSELLVLESADFERLVENDPHIAEAITAIVDRRAGAEIAS